MTTLAEPICFTRRCKYFRGFRYLGDGAVPKAVCDAYPSGIPLDILEGTDKHIKVRSDQIGYIVFEKGEARLGPDKWVTSNFKGVNYGKKG
jgi:hypothetical protein